MKRRITIACSECDKENLLEIFAENCPFTGYTDRCNENCSCENCIEDNINFIIVKSEVKAE